MKETEWKRNNREKENEEERKKEGEGKMKKVDERKLFTRVTWKIT